jgi:ADP-ribose pyrophosphatase YjhB (NUDIX family)
MEISTEWFYAPKLKASAVMSLFGPSDSVPDIRRVRAFCFCNGKLVVVYEAASNEWTFPGGGVEHGETPEYGMRREIQEESGREVVRLMPFGVLTIAAPSGPILRLWYVAEVAPSDGSAHADPAGDVTETKEVTLGELDTLIPWFPNARVLAEAALKVLDTAKVRS